jgi:competence protein ComEA
VIRARRGPVESGGIDRQIAAVEAMQSPGPRPSKRRRPSTDSSKATEPQNRPAIPAGPIDIDTAGASELEKLPGIGPALAKRIIAERDARGAFGCSRAHDQVKGIGPSLLARLDSLATFSGAPRAICVTGAGGSVSGRQSGVTLPPR